MLYSLCIQNLIKLLITLTLDRLSVQMGEFKYSSDGLYVWWWWKS